ncbi:MAG TPA: hypothetical protein VFM93_09675 [Candidatus Limnocylindria bacterium]|nr:hypothetical protein [Candidatus Limnocylindria bacterium]
MRGSIALVRWLLRLYPREWRERYGAEIEALLERRPPTFASLVDLVRGILDAHLHPHLASELVFVPEIGFRPAGTRVLLERAQTMHDDAVVTIMSVAASPERTDVMVQWESHRDANVACATPVPTPSTTVFSDQVASAKVFVPGTDRAEPAPTPWTTALADQVASAKLVVPGTDFAEPATNLGGGTRAFMTRRGWSVRTVSFPPLPAGTTGAEVHISNGETEWRVPFRICLGRVRASATHAETELHGITLRITAATRRGEEVVLDLEAQASNENLRLGSIGASPPPLLPPGVTPARNWSPGASALVLEDDGGRKVYERARIRPHEASLPATGAPRTTQRFASVFRPVDPDADSFKLIVPEVEVNQLEGATEVDLRSLPVDVDIAGQRFRVARVEPSQLGAPMRRLVIEIPPTEGPRRFARPLSIRGLRVAGGGYAWGQDLDGTLWMETAVDEPPVVMFSGVSFKFEGPWIVSLEI